MDDRVHTTQFLYVATDDVPRDDPTYLRVEGSLAVERRHPPKVVSATHKLDHAVSDTRDNVYRKEPIGIPV
jgi:hypothetical protein